MNNILNFGATLCIIIFYLNSSFQLIFVTIFGVFKVFVPSHSSLPFYVGFVMQGVNSHIVGYTFCLLIFYIMCCASRLSTPFRFCRIFAQFLS